MALQEAKQMGLDLLPDPETLSNAPRGATAAGAKYLYDNRHDADDWGSTASESDHDDEAADLHHHKGDGNENENGQDDDRETGGLTDREIDRLDGKTSSHLGSQSSSTAAAAAAAGGGGAPNQKYPERETGANTGPKGVLADQKYHQQQQTQERQSTHQAYNARMLAKALTTTTFREDEAREKKEKQALEGKNDEDDEDEKELERIRSKRLQDMRTGAGAGRGGGGGALLGKKMFGSLMEMNAAQYVSAIDSEKKDVTVIIHIYSEFDPACKKLDRCLIQLAGRYATTKFIRIKSSEVDFDKEVCPTVLVYRAGDLIANLVMITYELSEEYDDIELEELLTKNKVISPHDQCQRENSFFEHSLDTSSLMTPPMSSHVGELNMMSLGLGVGDGSTIAPSSMTMGTSTLSSSSSLTGMSSFGGSAGGVRRGILSGNVKEFQYQDYDDDDDDV
ncbi:hypothetical protein BG011_006992 [Mortierella polycephala]|uniref:Phosducin domain-containing protein n=1 Tax=Mortierella polycephala TaxID=41804 RepID=A0A9P6TZ99_9FUNG|nr:hypothetical protein BG011_006992 [Mortierella polycephala]